MSSMIVSVVAINYNIIHMKCDHSLTLTGPAPSSLPASPRLAGLRSWRTFSAGPGRQYGAEGWNLICYSLEYNQDQTGGTERMINVNIAQQISEHFLVLGLLDRTSLIKHISLVSLKF